MRRPERRDNQPGSIQGAVPWRTVTETWEEAENRAYDGLMTGGAADAIVVGAGVIGLTTGIWVAEAGLRVRIAQLSFPDRRPRRRPSRWSAQASPRPRTPPRHGSGPPWRSSPGSPRPRRLACTSAGVQETPRTRRCGRVGFPRRYVLRRACLAADCRAARSLRAALTDATSASIRSMTGATSTRGARSTSAPSILAFTACISASRYSSL